MKCVVSVLAAVLLLVLTSCVDQSQVAEPPRAVDGLLDLRDWNPERDGPVKLDGQWEFYWGELHAPESFASKRMPERTGLAAVPAPWTTGARVDTGLPGIGYSTYRLVVLHNGSEPGAPSAPTASPGASSAPGASLTANPTNEALAIRHTTVSTAFRLYVNGVLTSYAGVVGTGSDASLPQFKPGVARIEHSNDDRLELILQVSNFDYRTGGPWRAFSLGSDQDLAAQNWRAESGNIFRFGSLLVIALYHFVLFVIRLRESYFLHLGLLSFLTAVRTLFVGEYIIARVWPALPFEAVIRIEYLSYFLAFVAGNYLFRALFLQEFHNWEPPAVTGVTAVFSAVVLFTPPRVFTHIVQYHQAFALIACVYVAVVVGRAVARRRRGALLSLLGFAIMTIAVVNDILYQNFVINTGNLADGALILFVFTQAVVVSIRVNETFKRVESLSAELSVLNDGLEQQVQERTLELQTAYESIKELSVRDQLTNCYNRRFFDDQFAFELDRSRRYARPLSVVMCDIDHFKKINDSHGHQHGDKTLISVANTLREALRENVDWACRYGGEEFIIVMPETPPQEAAHLAERMRRLVEQTTTNGADIRNSLTMSFGVGGTEGGPGCERITRDAFIASADRMLYRAKGAGRNTVVVDTPLECGVEQTEHAGSL